MTDNKRMIKKVLSNKILILIVIFQLVLSSSLYAIQIGPAEFQEQYQTNDVALKLHGVGLKTFLSIKIVAIALYLEEGTSPEDVLNDVPKRLEVVYLKNIEKEELQDSTIEGIKKNVSEEEFRQLSSRIEQINSYYPDVQPQDRIQITYLPEEGVTVFVNGERKGAVEGEDFARAFFSIWLGDHPVDKKMKLVLLGYHENDFL